MTNPIKIELARMTGFLHSMNRFYLNNNLSYVRNGDARLLKQKSRMTSLAMRGRTSITTVEIVFLKVYLMELEVIKKIGIMNINLDYHEDLLLHLFHIVPGITSRTYVPLNHYENNYGNMTVSYGLCGHNESRVSIADYSIDREGLQKIKSDIVVSVNKTIIPLT